MEKISVLKKAWLHKEIAKLSAKNISKADIARDLDVKPQYINTILNSDRGITDQFLDKFIEYYNINHFDLVSVNSEVSPGVSMPEESVQNAEKDKFMINILKSKDDRIEELSKEVGRLEEKNEELKKLIRLQEQGARDAGCADVG